MRTTDTPHTTGAVGPTDTGTTDTGSTDAVAAFMAENGADLMERLNHDFADAVAFIGRVLGARPDTTAARLTGIDTTGVACVVVDPGGEHACHIAFAEPVTDPGQITPALFELLARAREQSGEEEPTSADRELAVLSTYRTFLTRVVATRQVHPHLREITFGGGDLGDFAPVGPDTFLYVLLPPPGRTDLTIDQTFSWETVHEMPAEDQPVGAYYTLRRWRPEAGELDMWFVLHGDSGPASAWAIDAAPGDPVALWGPRTAFEPPADTDWYLLVADDTGLPAVAGILESLPEGTVAKVFAEVDGEATRQPLPHRPEYEVTWLHRNGAAAGTTTRLADAVRSMVWPGGRPYVWGGGESRTMTAVRRHVRGDRGLAREAVSLVAYWRHADTPAVDEADPSDDD